jgi:hypothetical protein
MKALMPVVSFMVMAMVVAAPVSADGQYGEGPKPPAEKPREEVVHPTVDAGFGDNILVYAAALGSVGAAFYGVSRMTRRIYLFER